MFYFFAVYFFFFFPMTSAQLAGSGGVVREPTKTSRPPAQIAPKDNQWGATQCDYLSRRIFGLNGKFYTVHFCD